MNKKLKYIFIIVFFAYISFQYGNFAKRVFSDVATATLESYVDLGNNIKNFINEHFHQIDEIRRLREKNLELEKTASLSVAFADKLNSVLKERNLNEYSPIIEMAQAISYVNLSDYNRVWLKMNDFNESKIYGLIRNGVTAGIVAAYNKRPLAILQEDNKCIFSVYVGGEKIPGVAMGDKTYMNIKYIPQWMNPKIGDEVRTSGLDDIFFGGIPVGKVVEVIQEESFQTAIVKPYATIEVPGFYYVVK